MTLEEAIVTLKGAGFITGNDEVTSDMNTALQVMTDYCKRGVEIGERCPAERTSMDESGRYSKHGEDMWGEDYARIDGMLTRQYNKARADMIHWVNSRLSEVEGVIFDLGITSDEYQIILPKNSIGIIANAIKRLFKGEI